MQNARQRVVLKSLLVIDFSWYQCCNVSFPSGAPQRWGREASRELGEGDRQLIQRGEFRKGERLRLGGNCPCPAQAYRHRVQLSILPVALLALLLWVTQTAGRTVLLSHPSPEPPDDLW